MVGQSLNLAATSFHSKDNSLVIGPMTSICLDFQQGSRNHSSHHEKEDGEQQLMLFVHVKNVANLFNITIGI